MTPFGAGGWVGNRMDVIRGIINEERNDDKKTTFMEKTKKSGNDLAKG